MFKQYKKFFLHQSAFRFYWQIGVCSYVCSSFSLTFLLWSSCGWKESYRHLPSIYVRNAFSWSIWWDRRDGEKCLEIGNLIEHLRLSLFQMDRYISNHLTKGFEDTKQACFRQTIIEVHFPGIYPISGKLIQNQLASV